MSPLYEPIRRLVRALLLVFFRRVEVTGLEHVPRAGGGILVSWHPNGLVDPALIFAFFPRPVVFGARDGLFAWPGLGWLMRAIGTVPIFRAGDAGRLFGSARNEANARSLDALAAAVLRGEFSCLFPEGDSHDTPHLIRLKTGAARFYSRARQLQAPGAPPPAIVPVGLHYDAKLRFRSNALVTFHPPLVLPAELDTAPCQDEAEESARERCRALTERLERALREVVFATESWELHHLMHRARKVLRAERALRAGVVLDEPGILERQVGYARIWAGLELRRQQQPAAVAALLERLAAYDADMRALGLDDHELDRPPGAGARCAPRCSSPRSRSSTCSCRPSSCWAASSTCCPSSCCASGRGWRRSGTKTRPPSS